MKQFFFLFALLCALATTTMAQEVSVKDFSLLPKDITARTTPRDGGNGKNCALIKVNVVGVKDLQFAEAVGDVAYELGEYRVYVPENLKSLSYSNASGDIKGKVNFDDFGIDITSQTTYRLQFNTRNNLRQAIFSVSPATASLTFNGQTVALDDNGLAEVDLPVGKYSYKVTAEGCDAQEGDVVLTDEEISTFTSVSLQKRTYPLKVTCTNNPQANLFIDNVPYGELTSLTDLTIEEGHHELRLADERFNDWTQSIDVTGQPEEIVATMKQIKEKVVKHREERSRTRVNVRNSGYLLVGGSMYSKDDYNNYVWSGDLKLNFMVHTFGAFAIHFGINGGVLAKDHKANAEYNSSVDDLNKEVTDDDDKVHRQQDVGFFGEIPLQVGISIPFGSGNRNTFSILGGGYGGVVYNAGKDEKGSSNDKYSITDWTYGLRATARIDINKFCISGDVSKGFADHYKGLYFSVQLGWRFYM